MLAMPEVNYIKHLRENEDLTINEIAKKTGRNWRTVKKYAEEKLRLKLLPSKKRNEMKVDYLCPKTCAETTNLDNLNVNAIV